jgi:hypothetical protein
MATATQWARFRRYIGDAAFDTDVIDELFVEALEVYPAGSDELLMAYAVVAGIESLLATSAKRVSYQEGSASESLSDQNKALLSLLKYWKDKLEELAAEDGTGVAIQWGSLKKFPTRIQEYPDG